MINEEKLEKVLLDLGYPESLSGTRYLREAVGLFLPGMAITKELYPQVARLNGTTPSRIERAIRHATQTAWCRGSITLQELLFGSSINPQTGVPTNGELVARLARVCNEN